MPSKQIVWLFSAILISIEPAHAADLSTPPQREIKEETEIPPKEEVILSAKVENQLTLEGAIAKALSQSPRLKSVSMLTRSAAGDRAQAATLPNPEISVSVDNFGGKEELKGMQSAEITYGASQLIEIGGKRGARIESAEKGLSLAQLDVQAEHLNLIRDVTTAFFDAATAEANVELATKQKELAGDVLTSVTKRVEAAADPLYQRNKAEIADATSSIALENAKREAVVARQKLAVLWGDKTSNFTVDQARLMAVAPPDPLGSLEERVNNNPDYLRWTIELERKNAEVSLQKANAIPDPTINVGVRDLRESGEQAFVAGISLPLPVFDSNSGNISKALAESRRAEFDGTEARNQLLSELTQASKQLQTAYGEAITLEKEIIPLAEESFRLARHGYGIGKFPYLEVLDAQRTLFEAKEQHLNALRQYQTSRVQVERLTAKNKITLESPNEDE